MIQLPNVPYLYQGDSSNPSQAWRMCFSSSCAMMLEALLPGVLSKHPDRRGRQLDDFYRETLTALRVGDTTEYTAQLRTLERFARGRARFRFSQSCGWADVERQLARGVPVPIGILHHGPAARPVGGGHWVCVTGANQTHLTVHDPAGELDVANGGYLRNGPTDGRGQRYSRANLGPRWMVGGSGGWAILAERVA